MAVSRVVAETSCKGECERILSPDTLSLTSEAGLTS